MELKNGKNEVYDAEIQKMVSTAINEHKFGNITNVNELYSKFAKSTNIRFNIKNLIRFVNQYPNEVDQSDNFLWFCKFDSLILNMNRIRVLNKIGKLVMKEKAERRLNGKKDKKMNERIFDKINTNPNFLIDNERCLDFINVEDDRWFCMNTVDLYDTLSKILDLSLSEKLIENIKTYKEYDVDEAYLETLNYKDIVNQIHGRGYENNEYIIYPEAFTNNKFIIKSILSDEGMDESKIKEILHNIDK